MIERFHLAVDGSVLADLAGRLDRTRLPDLPPSTDWADGCNFSQLRAFLDYWRSDFNWRSFEDRTNRWPQFLATIDSARIHVLRISLPGPERPIPLLMLHGWPGSWVELIGVAERLAAGRDGIRFEVIIPSLPGFGYSQRPQDGELSVHRTAAIMAELMRRIGYSRYFVQGGDLGAGVGSALALRFPERVLGLHLNFIPGSYRPFLAEGTQLDPAETAFFARRAEWADRDGAYAHIQGTRPHALSVGLNDSPAGLAAWILEKFASWSDCGGELSRLPNDVLAANLTLYWVTGSIATSFEFYRDGRRTPQHFAPGERITVPCAVAHFPWELPLPPRQWIERGYNLTRWTDQPRGGHFAAMEEPELLEMDIRAFCAGFDSTLEHH